MKKFIIIGGILGALLFLGSDIVWAADLENNINVSLFTAAGQSGYAGSDELTFVRVVGTAIQTLLGLLGIVFMIMIIYAGFNWMIARGDAGKVDKSLTTIQNAVIGLAIVILAFAITNFVEATLIQVNITPEEEKTIGNEVNKSINNTLNKKTSP